MSRRVKVITRELIETTNLGSRHLQTLDRQYFSKCKFYFLAHRNGKNKQTYNLKGLLVLNIQLAFHLNLEIRGEMKSYLVGAQIMYERV